MDKSEYTRCISSSSTSSTPDDDPLMKDCIVLRQRLIETEESLRNLTVTPNHQSPNGSGVEIEKSVLSEHPPVLTLADLTPISSENVGLLENKIQRMHSSLNDIEVYQPILKQEKKSAFSLGTHSDIGNLRKKLFTLREENSSLFMQNSKLMTELEKTSFKLKQCQDELHEMNCATHENNQLKECSVTVMETLETQIKNKNHTIKKLEQMVIELRNHLKQQDRDMKEQKKSFEESLHRGKQEIEEWKQTFLLQKQKENDMEHENSRLRQNNQQDLSQLQKERNESREKCNQMKAENLHFQEQMANMKKELVILLEKSTTIEGLSAENGHLKSVIVTQQQKLTDYEEEIITTKDHVTRLEIVQKIQEDEITTSRTDSGITVHSGLNSIQNSSGELYPSPRAVIADLNLKLAMKDTEIQKLKATLSSTNFSQQKMKADYDFEGNNIRGLRSELTSVMERTRQGDVKQLQLEQSITRIEEELSGKTTQIVELDERLSDKVALITSLENKLTNRNKKIVGLQTEVDQKNQEYEDMENELQKSIESLQSIVNDKKRFLGEKDRQLEEKNSLLESYSNQIVHLENALLAHGEETKATDELVNKIKSLHTEHCKELEKEIKKLRGIAQEKDNVTMELGKKLQSTLSERKTLESTVNELKAYIQKMDELMDKKKIVIETYEEKIKIIQNKADQETRNMEGLRENLSSCKQELQKALTETNAMKEEHELAVINKTSSIQYLAEDLKIKTKHIKEIDDSYKKALEMLDQSQHRITELEELQNNYEDELTQAEQNNSTKLQESKQELSDLQLQVKRQEEAVKIYEEQVRTINTAFENAKNKIIELGNLLKTKEDQHLLQREEEIKKARKVKKEMVDLQKIMEFLKHEKEMLIKENNTKLHEMRKECSMMENKLTTIEQKNADRESYLNHLQNDNGNITDAYRKIERMMAISNDNVNIKEKELSDCHHQMNELKQLLNEQKWKLKQKAAQFTQLEMSCKQEKSEYEKKLLLSEGDVGQLKEGINGKDSELSAAKKKLVQLQMEYDDLKRVCFEHETRLKLHENSSMNASTELRNLKEDIVSCQVKMKQQSDMEREMELLKNQTENIQSEVQSLQEELMSAQQTVLQLTNELDDAHALLALKESDCTRLARELGASQVREAQEKARLNQELCKSLQDQEWKVTKKNEEIDTIRDRNEGLVTNHQQEIMKLRLRLQRTEDERKLSNNDLKRSKTRIKELEDESKLLSTDLHAQQQKSNELNEALVLRESEVARYSARLSGYERGILTNRTKSTAHSDESNFILKENLFLLDENNETTSHEATQRTIKVKAELEKSCTQVPHGSSLDALLKRTGEELRNLNLTNGLNVTTDNEHSFDATLSSFDSSSMVSYDAP